MISRRVSIGIVLFAALTLAETALADSLLETLLRVAGLTAAPSSLRDPDDRGAGTIWIAEVDLQRVAPATSDDGYRSPIFSPAGNLIALKGDRVVRVGPDGATPVQRLSGAVKLVGFDGRHPDRVVVLRDSPSAPLVVLSLETGALTPLPYDAASEAHQRMLAQIRSAQRVYGTTRVFVKTESKPGLSRRIEWTDVYVQRGDAAPRNVSSCDGTSCAQPALSADGRRVAFVKAGS